VVGGDRPDLETSSQRVRDFLAEVRGYAGDTGGPPAHSWPVEWQGRVVGWLAHPALSEYGCNCSGVWWPAVGAADFLSAAGQPPPGCGWIIVGGIRAVVKSLPDGPGRMEFWPHVSPQADELLVRPDADPLYGL
jgi:hypothetical protein